MIRSICNRPNISGHTERRRRGKSGREEREKGDGDRRGRHSCYLAWEKENREA